jgi:pSer/pThr/pTyr-binding forkhead associated (FHA) protein
MARLVVRLSDSDVRHFHLNRPEVLIGRDADSCQIVLRSNGVSRRHARITREGTVYRIEDLASRNGTTVNLIRLSAPSVLADKDQIRICEYTLQFEADATAECPTLEAAGRAARCRWPSSPGCRPATPRPSTPCPPTT